MRKKVLTMSVVLILVLLIVLAVVVAALGSVRFQQGRARHSENPDEFPGVLRFVVPDGQDPEAVVAGLELTDLEVSLQRAKQHPRS